MLVLFFSSIIIGFVLIRNHFTKRYTNDFLIENHWIFQENIYGDNINYFNARSIWKKGFRIRYGSEFYYPS